MLLPVVVDRAVSSLIVNSPKHVRNLEILAAGQFIADKANKLKSVAAAGRRLSFVVWHKLKRVNMEAE